MEGVHDLDDDKGISRRGAVKALGVMAGAVFAAGDLFAQQRAEPPTTITNPPRDFDQPTTYFTDPDILTVDPSFNAYVQPQNSIRRLWTGGLWLEGPAWSGVGKYLVFSDIPNNRQMRWSEDDGRVTVFRLPANNSNGNTFDFQGRQLSCEHLMRRVVRYEHDGSVTIIADNYGGKRLNSPNDVVPHPDGSYWFTDPPYGGGLFEGQPDAAGGPTNAGGRLNPRLGLPPELGTFRRELPTECLPSRSKRQGRSRGRRGSAAGSQRARLLAGLQAAVCHQHRPRARATQVPAGRAKHVRVRRPNTRRRPIGSSSATSWSTASSAGPTAHDATSTATSGARATRDGPSGTTA